MKTRGRINKQELPESENIGVVQLAPAKKREKPPKARSDRDAYHPELATHKRTRRFHFALVFAAMLLILVGVGVAWAYDSFEGGSIAVDDLTSVVVNLNVNSQPEEVATNCATVEELLNEQHIRLTEDDYLAASLDQHLYDGMTIWLRLAVDVTVKADQEEYVLHTQPITVAQALAEAGVEVDEDDVLDHPLLSYVYQDTTVTVNKMDTRLEEVMEEIEPPVETREVAYLTPGSTSIVTKGTPGQQRSVYSVTYKDGVEISRELISSEVVIEPTATIEGVGPAYGTVLPTVDENGNTILHTATASDGSEFYYSSSLSVQATAYTATGNRTATGTWPAQGRTIAVDPRVIPLGTRVYVVGYGFAVAEDTGGAVKGNIIDLYMDSYTDCINWGRRTVTVYILAQ